MNILIASNRPFPNRDVKNPEELSKALEVGNACIFFPYWSWKVSKEILDANLCIGFHTGEISGGSPIQNLIRQGVENSNIKMFKMNETIDGGEIIDIAPISLLGSLEEIVLRGTKIIKEMIDDYIHSN
jgi:methionyl-tRNA formyltransferase